MAKKTSKRRVQHEGSRTKRKVVRRAGKSKRGKAAAGAGGQVGRALAALEFAHTLLGSMLADFATEQLTYQPVVGGAHALWTIGHLATSYSWFASLIDGKHADMPSDYQRLFGYGSTPVADSSVYPTLEEIKSHHASAYKRLVDAMSSQSESDVNKPPMNDSHGFAKDRLEVMHRAVWHEGWHQGQIALIRRALGMKSVM